MFINLILFATVYGIKPVVSMHAASLGISPAQISLIVASYAFLPALLAVQIGKWTDKYGVRLMVVGGTSAILLIIIYGASFPGFFTFVLQQAVIGIAFTFSVVSLQKFAGNFGSDIDRSIANFSVANSLGAMIGPAMSAPLYEHLGYSGTLAVHIAMMALVVACALFIKKSVWKVADASVSLRNDEGAKSSKEPVWLMMRHRNLRNAVIISGLVISNRELFAAYFPLLALQLGVTPTAIGILMGFHGMAVLVVRYAQSRLVRAFGRMQVLTWSVLVSGLSFLAIPFSPWIVLLGSLVVVLGLGLGLGQPLSVAYTLQVSPVDRQGEVLGLRITVNRLSQLTVPLLFGGLGGMAGTSAVFWATGAVLSLFGYMSRSAQARSDQAQRVEKSA